MKRCAVCRTEAPDEATRCELCGSSAFVAAAPAVIPLGPPAVEPEPPAPEPPPPEPARSESTWVMPAHPQPAEPEAPEPEPPVAEVHAEPVPPALPAVELAPPEPAPAPAPDPQPAPALPPPEPPRQSTQRPGGATDRDVEVTSADVAAMVQEGWFTVGLLGFPTAGKTWFLNRLKDCYGQGDRPYDIFPPKVRQGEKVEGSTKITRHRFAHPAQDGDGGKARSFNVMDIPGERLETAVGELSADRDRELGNVVLWETLGACDALIVMMPADELLFSTKLADKTKRQLLRRGETPATSALDQRLLAATRALEEHDARMADGRRATKKDADARTRLEGDLWEVGEDMRPWNEARRANNVEDFCESLGKLAGVLDLLQSRPAGLVANMRLSELSRHIAEELRRPSLPVLFALSKIDAVESAPADLIERLKGCGIDDAQRMRVLERPAAAVKALAPTVAGRLAAFFEWTKFECVTAFARQPLNDVAIDYERENHGVTAIIDWIRQIEAINAEPARFAREVAWARRIGAPR